MKITINNYCPSFTPQLTSIKPSINHWARLALGDRNTLVAFCFVGTARMQNIYYHSFGIEKTTDVLSFPINTKHDLPKKICLNSETQDIDFHLLGEIVFCVPKIMKDSKKYKIPYRNRFAHLTIHSLLHLEGYNHQNDKDTNKMEKKEITLLKKLGIENPYQFT